MKRFTLFALIGILLVLAGGQTAAAQGIILPPPGVFTDPSWLRIDYHRVNVTIANQIATTHVDMQFTNEGEALAEGTFVFPLPEGAAVDQLTMHVDGVAIEARILPADEARGIYNEIVRQYRDPALLEYVGTGAIQANVFPIPPGASRRIEISYGQVLEVDNGLIHYVYPMNSARAASARSIAQMSISVDVTSNDPISSIYSPTHPIAISRQSDDRGFRAGFESSGFVADGDFSLYYGIASSSISVNLLTYRESADLDGFFLMLVQPPLRVPDEQVIPKDVIVVLDQSGSMSGPKWDQARQAASYVLENLNPGDRFNVIAFSTGVRTYSTQMETTAQARDAISWINSMDANGGTDINLALTTALGLADAERPTTVLFLTDGLATEGVTGTREILANLEQAARPNVRIFTFGIGDDVDTFLLDAIVRDFRGAGSYVRTGQRIDEQVASLYNKISAPVLTDIALDFGGARVELVYPATLSDLFAGEQLTLVGRYRSSAENVTITLSGNVNNEQHRFIYQNMNFPARAGGESFIARLWATRRIGDLLNTIRLNGENPELIESIVNLSVRYGIITPYTSFLIEEDDILSQQGRDRAMQSFAEEAEALSTTASGASAVDAAAQIGGMSSAPAPFATQTAPGMGGGGMGGGPGEQAADEDGTIQSPVNLMRTVGDRTFIMQNAVWTDTQFNPDTMETEEIVFLSDAYFDLLVEHPELGEVLALGERVIFVVEGRAYEIVSE